MKVTATRTTEGIHIRLGATPQKPRRCAHRSWTVHSTYGYEACSNCGTHRQLNTREAS